MSLSKQLYLIIASNKSQMDKDSFGFETQGDNYQNYRPSYPQQIIDNILKTTKNRSKYLDVATGTGQILFRIAPHFQEAIGTDISPNMIKSAKNKLTQNSNIQLFQTYCLDPLQGYGRFDLVTVAEALHWFPIPEFIQLSAQKLLTKEGMLVVIGYYRKGIFSETGDDFGNLYKQFGSAIQENTKSHSSELLQEYSDPKYNFKDRFESVVKETIDYKVEMLVSDLIKYLQTYSTYNVYKEKHPDEPDPIQIVENRLKGETRVILETRYFIFTCSKPIQ